MFQWWFTIASLWPEIPVRFHKVTHLFLWNDCYHWQASKSLLSRALTVGIPLYLPDFLMKSVHKPSWLMMSSGILLPNIVINIYIYIYILGFKIIQERGILFVNQFRSSNDGGILKPWNALRRSLLNRPTDSPGVTDPWTWRTFRGGMGWVGPS